MKKICIITGPTSGIGQATAYDMARMNFKLILVGRNKKKLQKLKENIFKKFNNESISIYVADLSLIEEVKRVGDEILLNHKKIDVLINNAGIYQFKRKEVKGIELTFAVNHLAYYILTLKLLPSLLNSDSSRIVNVSSNGHYRSKFNFEDYNRENSYKGFEVYSESKLANILFTYKLNDLIIDNNIKNITINALHPGLVRTKLVRSIPIIGRLFRLNPKFKSPKDGSKTTVYVATSADIEGVSGNYFSKMKSYKSSEESYDKENQDKLWQLSEKLTGISFELGIE